MYHLRLIKGLSYTGAVSASKEHPDVFTPDPEKYSKAMKSGYFEDLTEHEDNLSVPGFEDERIDDAQGEEASTSEEEFSEMSVENLKSYASLNGINLGSAKKKDDIIQKIEEAEDHAAEVRDSLR